MFWQQNMQTLGDSNKISPTPLPPTPVAGTSPPSLRPPLRPLRSPPPPAPCPAQPPSSLRAAASSSISAAPAAASSSARALPVDTHPFASASPSPVCPPQPRFIQRRRRPHAPYLLGAAPTGHGPHHHLRLLHSGVWARAVGSGTVPSSSSSGWVRAGGSRGRPFPPAASTVVPHPAEDPSRVESRYFLVRSVDPSALLGYQSCLFWAATWGIATCGNGNPHPLCGK